MLGHPRPGPGLRRRRRHQRRQGRADDRGEVREAAPPVRGRLGATRRSCSSTTGCTSAGCCRCWPTPTPCTSRRRSWRRSCTTCSPATSRRRRDDDQARRELESRAAGTKALGTWHATRTIQECREACGGAGYLAVNRFAALKADTDVFTTFEGDNHVLLQLVAKGLLTDYSSELRGPRPVRHGAVRGRDWPSRPSSRRPTCTSCWSGSRTSCPGGDQWDQEAGLLDPDYQLAMLRFREEHMLAGVARRLKRGIDQRMNPGVVFSRVQDHVIAAARAHVERLVLEAFVDKVRALPEGDLQGRDGPAVRPARAHHHRGRPRAGSWSTAGSRSCGPSRSAARSAACAAGSGRSPGTSSTASASRAEMLRSPDLVG